MGAQRVFLMVSGTLNRTTDEIEKVRRALGNKCVGVFDAMPAHSPRGAVIAAAEQARAADTDLIVAAHSHARITAGALARARLGGIGYHPSLLPRHRGIAAVEWTVKEGDPIAGGSIYLLAERMDAGPLAAQDWCFVKKNETARELWERALAPMGLRLLREVVAKAAATGAIPATPQQEEFATRAPMLS